MATFDGQEVYPGILRKVAFLLFKIVNNHPFIDGNKRVAFITALTILASNGYEFNCRQDEVIKIMLKVAKGKLNYEQICQWFKAHLNMEND